MAAAELAMPLARTLGSGGGSGDDQEAGSFRDWCAWSGGGAAAEGRKSGGAPSSSSRRRHTGAPAALGALDGRAAVARHAPVVPQLGDSPRCHRVGLGKSHSIGLGPFGQSGSLDWFEERAATPSGDAFGGKGGGGKGGAAGASSGGSGGGVPVVIAECYGGGDSPPAADVELRAADTAALLSQASEPQTHAHWRGRRDSADLAQHSRQHRRQPGRSSTISSGSGSDSCDRRRQPVLEGDWQQQQQELEQRRHQHHHHHHRSRHRQHHRDDDPADADDRLTHALLHEGRSYRFVVARGPELELQRLRRRARRKQQQQWMADAWAREGALVERQAAAAALARRTAEAAAAAAIEPAVAAAAATAAEEGIDGSGSSSDDAGTPEGAAPLWPSGLQRAGSAGGDDAALVADGPALPSTWAAPASAALPSPPLQPQPQLPTGAAALSAARRRRQLRKKLRKPLFVGRAGAAQAFALYHRGRVACGPAPVFAGGGCAPGGGGAGGGGSGGGGGGRHYRREGPPNTWLVARLFRFAPVARPPLLATVPEYGEGCEDARRPPAGVAAGKSKGGRGDGNSGGSRGVEMRAIRRLASRLGRMLLSSPSLTAPLPPAPAPAPTAALEEAAAAAGGADANGSDGSPVTAAAAVGDGAAVACADGDKQASECGGSPAPNVDCCAPAAVPVAA